MTWSQMEFFLRAASHVKADNLLADLAIAHNPYMKQARIERLPRYLRRQMREARMGEPMGIDARDGGRVSMTGDMLERQMAHVQAFLGPVKRVTLTREEFMKRQRAQQ